MGNIIIGILFIIGGASGEFVLRGTNSSTALVIAGIALIIWGLYGLIRNYFRKQQALKNPLLQDESIRGFYSRTKDQWASGRLDFIDANFKKASSMSLESFMGTFPITGDNSLGLFFTQFKPLNDEFLIGIGNTSSQKGWFVLTNKRLIQKDGATKQLYSIPMDTLKEYRTKGSWTKELTFIMDNGETVNLSKVEIYPGESYLKKLIDNKENIKITALEDRTGAAI